jgi:hypothetical protein
MESPAPEKGISRMAELMTSIGALAIILVGIAILLRITSLEEVFKFIGRAMAVCVLTLVVLCILRGLWLGTVIPSLSAAFESLKTMIEWLLVTVVGLVALSLIGRLVLRRFGRFLTLRRDPQTGEGHGINDSKDAKN